jgi:hypothetical protein
MRVQMVALFVSIVGLFNACSSVHVNPVKSASDEGVRFYRSLPYLYVTAPLVVKSDPPELLRYNNDSNSLVIVPIEEAKSASLPNGGKLSPQTPSAGTNYGSEVQPSGQMMFATLGKAVAPPPPPDAKKGDLTGLGSQSGQPAPASSAASTGKDPSPPTPPASIVYLPDPCQEYTITQKNHLASQTVGIMLNDGWQLSSLQSTSDNTGVVNSLIGAVGSALGGGKSSGGGGGSTGGSKAQGQGPQLFVKTVTYSLAPGIYPLFQRTRDGKPSGCDGTLKFVSPWEVRESIRTVQITPLVLP